MGPVPAKRPFKLFKGAPYQITIDGVVHQVPDDESAQLQVEATRHYSVPDTEVFDNLSELITNVNGLLLDTDHVTPISRDGWDYWAPAEMSSFKGYPRPHIGIFAYAWQKTTQENKQLPGLMLYKVELSVLWAIAWDFQVKVNLIIPTKYAKDTSEVTWMRIVPATLTCLKGQTVASVLITDQMPTNLSVTGPGTWSIEADPLNKYFGNQKGSNYWDANLR